MTNPDMDRPPEMVTFNIGDHVLDIPTNVLKGLDSDQKAKTKMAIARLIVGLAGNGDLTIDDFDTVLTLEGVMLTSPGNEGPVAGREFLGGILFTGHSGDTADIQSSQQEY